MHQDAEQAQAILQKNFRGGSQSARKQGPATKQNSANYKAKSSGKPATYLRSQWQSSLAPISTNDDPTKIGLDQAILNKFLVNPQSMKQINKNKQNPSGKQTSIPSRRQATHIATKLVNQPQLSNIIYTEGSSNTQQQQQQLQSANTYHAGFFDPRQHQQTTIQTGRSLPSSQQLHNNQQTYHSNQPIQYNQIIVIANNPCAETVKSLAAITQSNKQSQLPQKRTQPASRRQVINDRYKFQRRTNDNQVFKKQLSQGQLLLPENNHENCKDDKFVTKFRKEGQSSRGSPQKLGKKDRTLQVTEYQDHAEQRKDDREQSPDAILDSIQRIEIDQRLNEPSRITSGVGSPGGQMHIKDYQQSNRDEKHDQVLDGKRRMRNQKATANSQHSLFYQSLSNLRAIDNPKVVASSGVFSNHKKESQISIKRQSLNQMPSARSSHVEPSIYSDSRIMPKSSQGNRQYTHLRASSKVQKQDQMFFLGQNLDSQPTNFNRGSETRQKRNSDKSQYNLAQNSSKSLNPIAPLVLSENSKKNGSLVDMGSPRPKQMVSSFLENGISVSDVSGQQQNQQKQEVLRQSKKQESIDKMQFINQFLDKQPDKRLQSYLVRVKDDNLRKPAKTSAKQKIASKAYEDQQTSLFTENVKQNYPQTTVPSGQQSTIQFASDNISQAQDRLKPKRRNIQQLQTDPLVSVLSDKNNSKMSEIASVQQVLLDQNAEQQKIELNHLQINEKAHEFESESKNEYPQFVEQQNALNLYSLDSAYSDLEEATREKQLKTLDPTNTTLTPEPTRKIQPDVAIQNTKIDSIKLLQPQPEFNEKRFAQMSIKQRQPLDLKKGSMQSEIQELDKAEVWQQVQNKILCKSKEHIIASSVAFDSPNKMPQKDRLSMPLAKSTNSFQVKDGSEPKNLKMAISSFNEMYESNQFLQKAISRPQRGALKPKVQAEKLLFVQEQGLRVQKQHQKQISELQKKTQLSKSAQIRLNFKTHEPTDNNASTIMKPSDSVEAPKLTQKMTTISKDFYQSHSKFKIPVLYRSKQNDQNNLTHSQDMGQRRLKSFRLTPLTDCAKNQNVNNLQQQQLKLQKRDMSAESIVKITDHSQEEMPSNLQTRPMNNAQLKQKFVRRKQAAVLRHTKSIELQKNYKMPPIARINNENSSIQLSNRVQYENQSQDRNPQQITNQHKLNHQGSNDYQQDMIIIKQESELDLRRRVVYAKHANSQSQELELTGQSSALEPLEITQDSNTLKFQELSQTKDKFTKNAATPVIEGEIERASAGKNFSMNHKSRFMADQKSSNSQSQFYKTPTKALASSRESNNDKFKRLMSFNLVQQSNLQTSQVDLYTGNQHPPRRTNNLDGSPMTSVLKNNQYTSVNSSLTPNKQRNVNQKSTSFSNQSQFEKLRTLNHAASKSVNKSIHGVGVSISPRKNHHQHRRVRFVEDVEEKEEFKDKEASKTKNHHSKFNHQNKQTSDDSNLKDENDTKAKQDSSFHKDGLNFDL